VDLMDGRLRFDGCNERPSTRPHSA
jgi:hypothetical protein